MSQRHRQAKAAARSGREIPSAWDRTQSHRRVRHHVNQDLRMLDADTAEGAVLDIPVRSTVDTGEHEIIEIRPGHYGRSKPFWRQPFWKRRTQQRNARGRALRGEPDSSHLL